jgi:hypothetical protein
MSMVTERNDRISVLDLTRALSDREISMSEFIRAIEESYAFNSQIKVISSPGRKKLFVAYKNHCHPTLHNKLTQAGWDSDGIIIDERQTVESTERTRAERSATYKLDKKSKGNRFVFRRR